MRLFTFALLATVSLLLPSVGSSQTPSVTPPVRPVHLTFFYFRYVADQQFPDRPIQISAVRDPKTGHERYSFFDQRTQQRFRDGAQIKSDLARASATRSRPKLRELGRELDRWRVFLRDSLVILTEADLEPKSSAGLGGHNSTPVVSEVFTPQGTRKFSRFTKAHVGEITGVIVNDSVLSAPDVMEPITDSRMQISGGFASLSEAKALADGLNTAARWARKP